MEEILELIKELENNNKFKVEDKVKITGNYSSKINMKYHIFDIGSTGRIIEIYKNNKAFKVINDIGIVQIVKAVDLEKIDETNHINIGDEVRVMDIDEVYANYSDWFMENGYDELKSHFVRNIDPIEGDKYKVVGIGKHDEDENETILAIQNPETTQIFLIGINGVIKVK